MEASTQEKRFLIRVERTWKLWLWPLVAMVYFAWVMFLAAGGYETPGIPTDYWVLGGMGLFGFVVLVELLLLARRKVRQPKARKVKRDTHWKEMPPEEATAAEAQASGFERPHAAAAEAPAALPTTGAPARRAPAHEVEVRMTGEEVRGRKVLEVSVPPKSRNQGAVYAKSYIPVADGLVLRVEDLAAEPRDLEITA